MTCLTGIAARVLSSIPSVSLTIAPVVKVHAARLDASGSAGTADGQVLPASPDESPWPAPSVAIAES